MIAQIYESKEAEAAGAKPTGYFFFCHGCGCKSKRRITPVLLTGWTEKTEQRYGPAGLRVRSQWSQVFYCPECSRIGMTTAHVAAATRKLLAERKSQQKGTTDGAG